MNILRTSGLLGLTFEACMRGVPVVSVWNLEPAASWNRFQGSEVRKLLQCGKPDKRQLLVTISPTCALTADVHDGRSAEVHDEAEKNQVCGAKLRGMVQPPIITGLIRHRFGTMPTALVPDVPTLMIATMPTQPTPSTPRRTQGLGHFGETAVVFQPQAFVASAVGRASMTSVRPPPPMFHLPAALPAAVNISRLHNLYCCSI